MCMILEHQLLYDKQKSNDVLKQFLINACNLTF